MVTNVVIPAKTSLLNEVLLDLSSKIFSNIVVNFTSLIAIISYFMKKKQKKSENIVLYLVK